MRFFLSCLLQAAFLSALAGTKVAEAAARAAVTALSDIDHEAGKNAGGDPNGQGITDYSKHNCSLFLSHVNTSDTLFSGTQRSMVTTQRELWLKLNL